MVERNDVGKNNRRSREELSPCRQSVDAAAAKRALSAFVAACRATAAVATVTLAVSTAGCMGVPANWEIDNARDATQTDPQPTTQPVPTPGGIKAVQVTEDIVTGEPAFQRIEEE